MTHTSLAFGAIAAVTVLAIQAGAGQAAFIKRDFLLRTCTSKNPTELGNCTGYVIGIADAGLVPEAGAATQCVPEGVPVRHLREVVTSWLESHRSGADQDAAPLVRDALRAAYPCNKK